MEPILVPRSIFRSLERLSLSSAWDIHRLFILGLPVNRCFPQTAPGAKNDLAHPMSDGPMPSFSSLLELHCQTMLPELPRGTSLRCLIQNIRDVLHFLSLGVVTKCGLWRKGQVAASFLSSITLLFGGSYLNCGGSVDGVVQRLQRRMLHGWL